MIFKLIIAFIIGAVIGLERASPQKYQENNTEIIEHHEVGVRTFSLISLLGALAGLMMHDYQMITIFISAIFSGLILIYYFLQSSFTKDSGITTEFALVYSYVIGLMIGREILPIHIILIISVVLILVLSRKQEIHGFISVINRSEINAFISYALIALVILPFLPNVDYSLTDIPNAESFLNSLGFNAGKFLELSLLNPFKLWFIVALITGIDVAGYTLERTVGQKGKLMSSLAGGVISSTATTQALAVESKRSKSVGQLVGAALFANMISFIPLFFLIGSINQKFLLRLIPVLLSVIISSALTAINFYFVHKEKNSKERQKPNEIKKRTEIFNLRSALIFVGIFAVVRIASQIALAFFGNSGVIVTTSLAALTGVDAPILTVSQMAGGDISHEFAVWAFVLINAVNLVAKTIYSFISGSRGFAIRFGIGVFIIIVSSIIWPIFS